MQRPVLDFIVIGLPRSGTTWLANWLTTDHSLCLHDPFAMGMPETWPRDHRPRGISCTCAYLIPGWMDSYSCPVAIIERDPADCDASLERMGLPDTSAYRRRLGDVAGRRFAFNEIWTVEGSQALWSYLLPSIPFDSLRFALLNEIQVQPHAAKWMLDIPTLRAVAQAAGV